MKPETRGKVQLVLIALVLVAAVWVCIATGSLTPPGRRARATSPPATARYLKTVYVVEGSAASAAITLHNEQGGTEQLDAPLPFERELFFERGDVVYLSAQNRGERGTVTCKILVGGEVWRESTSEGAYKVVSCSGMIGEP